MIDLHGREWVDEKMSLKHQARKYTVSELQELEREFKGKAREMLKGEGPPI
jgi:hypothetical protein